LTKIFIKGKVKSAKPLAECRAVGGLLI